MPGPTIFATGLIVSVPLTERSQAEFQTFVNAQNAQVRTDSVDEAFMIYLKVSLVCGVLIASPYIFWEIWLFVAAGLYPHERKYVYTYLPMSLGLFLGGAALCFFAVIPIVLDFLFGFNAWLGLRPEMKIATPLKRVQLEQAMRIVNERSGAGGRLAVRRTGDMIEVNTQETFDRREQTTVAYDVRGLLEGARDEDGRKHKVEELTKAMTTTIVKSTRTGVGRMVVPEIGSDSSCTPA